jgi:endonuclease-3
VRHIGRLILRLRRQAPRWRQTALAEVAERRQNPFHVLIACLLSLRTKDETTGPAAARLFALADTPAGIVSLTPRQIQRVIFPVGFYRTKSRVLRGVCRDLLQRFGGTVPNTIDQLLTLNGVGRKTANLVVTQAYNKPGICVDIHVHRISNRWGYVRTATPEKTEMALRARLPRRYWIGYNDLLVSFGQNICLPVSPKCSLCPVADLCPRIGVTRSR